MKRPAMRRRVRTRLRRNFSPAASFSSSSSSCASLVLPSPPSSSWSADREPAVVVVPVVARMCWTNPGTHRSASPGQMSSESQTCRHHRHTDSPARTSSMSRLARTSSTSSTGRRLTISLPGGVVTERDGRAGADGRRIRSISRLIARRQPSRRGWDGAMADED